MFILDFICLSLAVVHFGVQKGYQVLSALAVIRISKVLLKVIRVILFMGIRNRSLLTGWGAEILRGATYFWQVADGGPLIFGAKNFEKARENHFSTRFGQK